MLTTTCKLRFFDSFRLVSHSPERLNSLLVTQCFPADSVADRGWPLKPSEFAVEDVIELIVELQAHRLGTARRWLSMHIGAGRNDHGAEGAAYGGGNRVGCDSDRDACMFADDPGRNVAGSWKYPGIRAGPGGKCALDRERWAVAQKGRDLGKIRSDQNHPDALRAL